MGFMANFKGRRAYSTHIRGNQAIDKGDIAKAAELHRQALKLYSEAYEAGCRDVNVVMAYGVLLMRFGEYEKARDLLLSSTRRAKSSFASTTACASGGWATSTAPSS